MKLLEMQDIAARKSQFFNSPAHRPPTPREVLEELFVLLEDYGPSWYNEEHHNRAIAALLSREA